MAAPDGRAQLRVRLTFDYPPPAVPESRHLWFLLDPEQCRAVTDVSAIIRERFFYSRRGALSLYLEGSLLPPGESVHVIRDNDALSVKWEENLPQDSTHQTAKKRPRVVEETDDYRDLKKARGVHRGTPENSREASPAEHEVPVRPNNKVKGEVIPNKKVRQRPKKKRNPEEEVRELPKKGKENPEKEVRKRLKKKRKETLEEEVRQQPEVEVRVRPKKKEKETPEEEIQERPKKKGKETPEEEIQEWPKKKDKETNKEVVRQQPKKKGKGTPKEVVREQLRTKEGEEVASQEDESDDCSYHRKNRGDHTAVPGRTKKREEESSEEELKKNQGVAAPVGEEMVKGTRQFSEKKPGKPSVCKELEIKKLNPPEDPLTAAHRKAPGLTQIESSSSSSDQEDRGLSRSAGRRPPVMAQQSNGFSSPDTLSTKKPLISSPTFNGHMAQGFAPHRAPLQTAGRGAGRGQGTDNLPWRGRGFRGQGEAQPQNHFFYNYSPETIKEQQLNEDASNVSVLIQNPPGAVNKDYSTLPLLAAPPQPGKIIAFKLLELTENYSPEVSDYKEGRVLSYDAVSQELEVEVLSQQKKKEPGKFDLIYEGEDGMDVVEYAVPQESKITQHWSSLIEPRLVTESDHPALLAPGP